MKNQLILIFIVIGIIVGAYFLGHYKGSSRAIDDIKMQHLQDQYDSLAAVIKNSTVQLRIWDDSIAVRDNKIAELKKELLLYDQKVRTIAKYYEVKLSSFNNASLSKLDSFLWARYPDSSTVAGRGHR